MLGSSWDKEKVKGSGEDLKRENKRERKGGTSSVYKVKEVW